MWSEYVFIFIKVFLMILSIFKFWCFLLFWLIILLNLSILEKILQFFARSCTIWKGFWGKLEYILRDEFFIHFTGLLEQFLALNSSLDLWRKWSNLGKLNDNLVFFILFSSCLEALFVLILLRAIHKLHWDNLHLQNPPLC